MYLYTDNCLFLRFNISKPKFRKTKILSVMIFKILCFSFKNSNSNTVLHFYNSLTF